MATASGRGIQQDEAAAISIALEGILYGEFHSLMYLFFVSFPC